jgi:catechol 2,3-dioxygenase-like lactoylglutathione lyase family enzyme
VNPLLAAPVAAFLSLRRTGGIASFVGPFHRPQPRKERTVLTHSKLQSIIWTSRIAEAEIFYRDVLRLTLRTKSDGALVFDVAGSDLRVSPVPSTTPSDHTVMGFAIDDADAVIASLRSRGVVFERFAGFPHAANGTVITPDGNKVAWFRDPDGNILSVVQFARAQSRENCDALSTSQSYG